MALDSREIRPVKMLAWFKEPTPWTDPNEGFYDLCGRSSALIRYLKATGYQPSRQKETA